MSRSISRRQFSKGLAAAGAVAAAGRSVSAGFPANESVRLGILGTGNRGDQLISAFQAHPDVRITALCDVYRPYLEFARDKVGGDPFMTEDYRKVLDREDVDAVVIATPDHWHAIQFIEACIVGKDVFVEKPLSLTIDEGRRMVRAARKYGRITQVGTHRRSSPLYKKAMKLIHDGAIGKVSVCRAFRTRNEWPMGIGDPPDSEPPSGLNWDMFLGPAPRVPYNPNRGLYMFRWFRPYSGGQLTNFGVHYIDSIHWGLQQDRPLNTYCVGGRYAVEDNREIPDTLEAVWEYPGGTLVSFVSFDGNGAPGTVHNAEIEFRGTKGTLYLAGRRLIIDPSPVRTAPLPALDPTDRRGSAEQQGRTEPACEPLSETGVVNTEDHARDFLDGVKTRRPCACPVEVGHRSNSAVLLAGMSFDRKRSLNWDAESERVTNDPEANELLSYEYREPWRLPE